MKHPRILHRRKTHHPSRGGKIDPHSDPFFEKYWSEIYVKYDALLTRLQKLIDVPYTSMKKSDISSARKSIKNMNKDIEDYKKLAFDFGKDNLANIAEEHRKVLAQVAMYFYPFSIKEEKIGLVPSTGRVFQQTAETRGAIRRLRGDKRGGKKMHHHKRKKNFIFWMGRWFK